MGKGREVRPVPVSYTHLDVYKRQAKEAYYGKWQIKGEFLILTEMVPEDIPLCVSSGNRLRQWYYWIKDRNMLIRFIRCV